MCFLVASAKAEIQDEASGVLKSPKGSHSFSHVKRVSLLFVPGFETVSIN